MPTLVPKPVAFWTMNGTRVDNVGELELVSGDGLEHYVAGKIEQGWNAAGTNYKLVQSSPFPLDGPWTYSLWVNPSAWSGAFRMVFSKPAGLLQIRGRNSGAQAEVAFNNTYLVSVATVALNDWNHVVVTFDPTLANKLSIWVNGVSISGGASAVGPTTETGMEYGNSLFGYFRGALDAIGFWNQRLTDEEVLELYAAGDGWEYTPPDNTPDAFDFVDVTDADLSTLYESGGKIITGMDAETAISIAGGEYRINSGPWKSDANTINPGDTVTLRATSSSNPETPVTVSVTVGTVTEDWTITTAAALTIITNILHGSTPETSRILRSRIVQGIV